MKVGVAFGKLEEGYESAIKDYYKKQIAQLNNLVTKLYTDNEPCGPSYIAIST